MNIERVLTVARAVADLKSPTLRFSFPAYGDIQVSGTEAVTWVREHGGVDCGIIAHDADPWMMVSVTVDGVHFWAADYAVAP